VLPALSSLFFLGQFEMRSLFGAEKTAAANTVKTLEQEVRD
jgi:hypothetical protein